MKKLIIHVLVLASATFTGCKSIEVNNRGSEVALDGDGQVVRDTSGNPIVIYKGWDVDYFQHWNWQKFDAFSASVETNGAISVTINGYASGADSNLVHLVSASLDGVATVADKVLAAMATQGVSLLGDAASMALKACEERWIANGGDPSKLQVTCKDGSCTLTDGTVTETCTDCCTDCKTTGN